VERSTGKCGGLPDYGKAREAGSTPNHGNTIWFRDIKVLAR
jgi:hypothetical protein